MSQNFRLRSELTGAIAKRLPHAKNQLSVPGSSFNQFVAYIYTNINRVLIVRINLYSMSNITNTNDLPVDKMRFNSIVDHWIVDYCI